MAISRLTSMIAVTSMYTKKNTRTSADFLGQRTTSGLFKYTVLLSLQSLFLPRNKHKIQKIASHNMKITDVGYDLLQF